MANISQYLAAIMSAIYGRDVRSSIHDAIREINTAQEQAINAGTAIVDGDPAGGVYDKSYYFNTATNDLLECDGTTWHAIDNLEGNAITSITGPVTDPTNPLIDVYTIHFSKIADRTFIVNNGRGISSITGPVVDPSAPLTDVYTINFNDGTSLPYSVENGRGIVSIDGPASVGLLDTYTINFNDGTTQPFIVTNGKDGKTWYRGIKVYGKVVRDTVFNDSGILNAQEGDFYLNYSEGAIYHCTLGGAPTVATWLYDFTISGGGSSGAQFLDDLDDVAIDATSLGNKQILIYDSTSGQWVNANLPIDQTFDGASANAQSGKAVKEAVDKNYSIEDTAETDIADADYFPFYDTSATAKKKSLWSNIKAKLKAYFDGIYTLLTIVGTVESGTTSSRAYAVGEHFIKDGYFCTAIAAIAQGATFTLNTNYTEGDIAEALENSIDVTSSAFGTLPSGLSVEHANLHKATKCGHMITATIALSRTSNYPSGTQFDYIKEGFRPKERIYAVGMDDAVKVAVIGIFYPNGKMVLLFNNNSATEAYLSVTYPIS